MARNRQRAKQRQAARRAAAGDGAGDAPKPPQDAQAPAPPTQPPASGHEDVERAVDLEVGAPPEDLGTSKSRLEYEQDLDEQAEDEQDLDEQAEEEREAEGVYPDEVGEDVDHESQPTGSPSGDRGGAAEYSHRPRFVQFLLAVRAELRRVQWPNRQALTTLTGVVLGFVLIAGGYLGLLDAVFSRIIQSIL